MSIASRWTAFSIHETKMEEPTRISGLPPGSRASVLLVDDQPANLLALEAVLAGLDLNLVRASSGEAALHNLREADFALVVLDVRMPGLDGFQTARRIRTQDRSRHTPIIFVTAYDDGEFRTTEAYKLGAVDYLLKPLVSEAVRAKVAGLVDLFWEKERARYEAEQLRLLIQGTTDHAIYMLDPIGNVVTWNAGAERIKGYRGEDIIGQHFSRFYTDEDVRAGKPRTELELATMTGRYEEEGWRVRKDGSLFWAGVVVTALRDGRGDLRGFSKVTRDLTDRRRADETLRQSEERFRSLVSGVKDYAIFMLDQAGNVVTWNAGAERIKGYRAEEIIGLHFSRFYTDEAVGRKWPAYELDQAQREGRFEDEGWRLRKDGSRFWANVVITALRDSEGRLFGFSKVTRDLTERKRAEDALRQAHDGLEELVGVRTAELTDANESLRAEVEERRRLEHELQERVGQLAEADQHKNEFLAMLAHELRNPLAPIRNAVQILKMPEADRRTAEHARLMMERQLQQLVRLVDDLLDVSRIMRGKISLDRHPVDLGTVVDRAKETVQPVIDAHGHELVVALPVRPVIVEGDLVRLAQVVGNLLTNAAKYTERAGRILLTAEADGDEAVIRVRDTGVGIPPDLLPRIFDLFVQAERSLARSNGGLGVGLTLVKRLVEMHGGTVEAHSEGLGMGCEFVVRLPVLQAEPAADEAAAPSGAARHGGPARRVLVVDDNVDAADTAAILMRLWGHEVRTVHDGLSVLQAVRDFQPEIILLDIGLPGLTGYEVAQQLRSQPGLESVVLAAMTGYGQEEDRRRSRLAGFDHHLVKPLDPERLQALIGWPPV